MYCVFTLTSKTGTDARTGARPRPRTRLRTRTGTRLRTMGDNRTQPLSCFRCNVRASIQFHTAPLLPVPFLRSLFWPVNTPWMLPNITSPDSRRMSPLLTVSTTPSGVPWWKLLTWDVPFRVNVAAKNTWRNGIKALFTRNVLWARFVSGTFDLFYIL